MINIVFVFIFVLCNKKRYVMFYCPLTYDDHLILAIFYIKMSCIILFPQLSNQWFLGIFCHIFSKRSKNCINFDFRFRSTATFKDTKFLLPKRSKHQKTEQYQGSADRGELDLNSEVNRPASGKLRQSTTVSRQCEW